VVEILVRGIGLTKAFGGSPVLEGADIALRAGEVHALCGENGAGKSTLAKLLAGIHVPTAGVIEVGGKPVRFPGPRDAMTQGIALIPQEPQTFPDLSVAENLFLGRPPRKFGLIDTKEMNAQALHWLETVGASLDPRERVRGLSVADRQLIELAGALSQKARVLLLDETTASLTPTEVARLAELIARLKSEGCAIGLVSHRMEEIFSLCDRVTVLRDGRVVGERTIAETSPTEIVQLMVGRTPAMSPTDTRPGASEADSRVEPGETLLEARNLTRRRKFTDISLTVRAGEVVGLAGLVGAGRTEVARALFGLLPLDAGQIFVGGAPVRIHSPRDAMALGLALVPEDRQQQGALLPWSLWQNVTLPSLPSGWLRPAAEKDLTGEWIARLDVRCNGPEQALGQLSGGNQQKIVFGKWLQTGPKLLILDEPTRGVDVGAKARLHEEIRALKAKGVGVLLISSDLPEILALSDRLYVLRAGRVARELPREQATPEAVIAAASGAVS
jgi:ABC-type sugar transport system ATPase subunit